MSVFLSVSVVQAQPPGVSPLGVSDAVTAQLSGNVSSVRLTAWNVDFSRHTIERAEQVADARTTYDGNGMVSEQTRYDADGQLASRTVYQYDGPARKRVATTYDRRGERTLQTLYAYTADGALARMRLTDARAVTISTTEVSTADNYTETLETYNDGEQLRTRYEYDPAHHLLRVTSNDADTRFRLDRGGLPAKAAKNAAGKPQQAITYLHERDQQGNWTQRITFVDATPTRLEHRDITYR